MNRFGLPRDSTRNKTPWVFHRLGQFHEFHALRRNPKFYEFAGGKKSEKKPRLSRKQMAETNERFPRHPKPATVGSKSQVETNFRVAKNHCNIFGIGSIASIDHP